MECWYAQLNWALKVNVTDLADNGRVERLTSISPLSGRAFDMRLRQTMLNAP